MNQFNHNLVDLYLVPLLKRVMVDISQGKHASLLKKEPWVNKDGTKARPAEVEKFQMEYFLHGQNDQSVKPFIDPDNQLYFIKFLQEAIIAQAPADETTRRNFLIPTYKQDDKTPHFPPASGRMLYLMAYKIAGEFQKIEMAKIIEQKSEAEKENFKKLPQGRLIVTKNPTTGKFDQVQDITKIQPGQKIVPLISPPSDYGAGFMYGSGDFSTAEGATTTGASGVGTASGGSENAGLMPADITFPDDAVTMQTFQKGDANIHLTISDDPKNSENKIYTFESENDTEKKFTISADQFKALLQDPDTGKLRTVAEVFDLLEQQRMKEQETAANILQAAQELLGGTAEPQIAQGQPAPGQKKPQVEQKQEQKGPVTQGQVPTGAQVAPVAPAAPQGQLPTETEKPEPPAKKEPTPSPVSQLIPNAPVGQQQPAMVNRQTAPTQGAQTRPIPSVPGQKGPFDLKNMLGNKKPSYVPNAKPEKATPAPTEAKPQVTAAQPPAPTGYKPPVQQAAKSFFQKHGGKVVAGAVITSGFAAVLLPSWFTAINL